MSHNPPNAHVVLNRNRHKAAALPSISPHLNRTTTCKALGQHLQLRKGVSHDLKFEQRHRRTTPFHHSLTQSNVDDTPRPHSSGLSPPSDEAGQVCPQFIVTCYQVSRWWAYRVSRGTAGWFVVGPPIEERRNEGRARSSAHGDLDTTRCQIGRRGT